MSSFNQSFNPTDKLHVNGGAIFHVNGVSGQGISDSKTDLETLLQIEITDYLYKDTVKNGTVPQKKLIGQQVAEVFPQAVRTNTVEVVPDIMKMAVL